jgi:hypothetical protein
MKANGFVEGNGFVEKIPYWMRIVLGVYLK